MSITLARKLKLTDTERSVADEYLRNGFNKTQAYMAVKKNAKNTTARCQGPIIIAKQCVQDYIASKLAKDEQNATISGTQRKQKYTETLDDIINSTADDAPATAIKGIEVASKLHGLYDQDSDTANWTMLVQNLQITNDNRQVTLASPSQDSIVQASDNAISSSNPIASDNLDQLNPDQLSPD